jgi:Fe-S-cluster containining protein
MTEEMRPILPDEPMGFDCNAENSCYNECCRDLHQALMPYDILRMKKAVNMRSQAFLRDYTTMHYGPESGLPVVAFKPNPQTGHQCPFVTEKGCSIYNDRPASCRMYPLARAIARSRETGQINEYFAVIEESHCKGFENDSDKTVSQWLTGQNVERHNRENDKLMALISLKNRIMPGKLDGRQSDKFYLALYDLDEFRHQIVNNGLLDELDIPEKLYDFLNDDETLLNFGIEWVKFQLFGIEMTVTV